MDCFSRCDETWLQLMQQLCRCMVTVKELGLMNSLGAVMWQLHYIGFTVQVTSWHMHGWVANSFTLLEY